VFGYPYVAIVKVPVLHNYQQVLARGGGELGDVLLVQNCGIVTPRPQREHRDIEQNTWWVITPGERTYATVVGLAEDLAQDSTGAVEALVVVAPPAFCFADADYRGSTLRHFSSRPKRVKS
jgi:hypothetical protein